MRRNVVLPFRFIRPGSAAVKPGKWYRSDAGGTDSDWLEHGSGLRDWSYDTRLFLGREIMFDMDLLAEELDLASSGAEFELLHCLRIGGLGIRQLLHRERLGIEGEIRSEFFKELDSTQLCEELTLTSAIILRQDTADVPQWAPSKKGSNCWSDETRVILEGYGSRFPMQDLAFSSHHKLPDGASWHLEWRPGLLHYSFNSAVMLYLNSEKADFFERIQEGDEVLIEQVMSSITGEICGYLLEREEFTSDELDYPEGSLGEVARKWLRNAMPGRTLHHIRDEYLRSPNNIYTALRGLAANT